VADSDRLKILRQQRATIAEHLAWLDREIRRETQAAPPQAIVGDEVPLPPQTAPSPPPQTTAAAQPDPVASAQPSIPAHPAAAATDADPEAVLEEWTGQAGSSDQSISKSGCWLIFAAVAVIGIGGMVVILQVFY